MEKPEEMWFPILEAPDYYISNHGRVLSTKKSKPRFMKLGKRRDGYVIITLAINAKRKTFSIHRLVAQYFVPNPDNFPAVDHIDQVKSNNVFTNLRWVTDQENYWNQRQRQIGESHGRSKLTEKDVKTIRARRKKGDTVESIALEYGLTRGGIYQALKRCWKHVD